MAQDAVRTDTSDAAQAVQALLRFLGVFDAKAVEGSLQQRKSSQQSSHRTQHPLRTIQQPHEAFQPAATTDARQVPAAHVQQANKAAQGMTNEALQSQLQLRYSHYTAQAASRRMDTTAFLHLLADAHLLNNRFGVLEGHEVFLAAEAKEQAGKKQKIAGLTFAGFVDALHRMAAVKLTKIADLEEAYNLLLRHWVIPKTQQGPSDTALIGLFESVEVLSRCDGVLKQIFAWYASLPYLTGQVAWDQFKHTHKGVMAGHILLFLTDFKVVPGLLSVRQVTGVLQQHAACSKSPDSTLQYPQMLEVLCECAVLLRQQIQRKLAGPWVNLTELNALKRFLKLQAMPSLQEAYALPNSPKHIATITNSMQKVQLTQPPSPQPSGQAWPQFVPQHSRLVQNAPSQNLVMQSSAQQSHWALPRMHHKQQSSSNVDEALLQQRPLDTANAATASSQSSDSSTMAQPSLGHQREHSSANAASVRRQSNNNNLMKQSAAQQRHYASASAALQPGSTAAHKARPDWSNVTAPGSTKWLWERHDDMQPELQHFKEEELAEEAALQEQACKRHLAGREASKRRLLQHRIERLSSDPRMPARLAAHPSYMACSMTPPYALLDAAAATPMTALNMDGDGWSPCVDLVAIEPPSVKQRPGKGSGTLKSGTLGELPMHTLHRIPLDCLTATRLGKRAREPACTEDSVSQLADFDNRLPTLLCSWSIESERQQWTKALSSSHQLCTADAA